MRMLRPLFLIAHVRALRQQLTTIFKTLPKLVDIFVNPCLVPCLTPCLTGHLVAVALPFRVDANS